MDVERGEEREEEARMQEEPYEDLFVPLASRCALPEKMLDSASSGRELPARNSSISSLSSLASSDRHSHHPPLGPRPQVSRDVGREERKVRRREVGSSA